MKRDSLILLGVFLIFLSSCKKESDTPIAPSVLIPLNTGNVWTYRSTRLSQSGEYVDTVKTKIGSKVMIKGREGFIIENASRPFNAAFLGINDLSGDFVSLGGFSLLIP